MSKAEIVHADMSDNVPIGGGLTLGNLRSEILRVPLNVKDPAVTNLGYEPLPREFYPTPNWMAESLLDANIIPQDYGIWEPASGNGVLVKAARRRGYEVYASDIFYNIINSDTRDFLLANGLPLKHPNIPPAIMSKSAPGIANCRCIWTNPPFGERCKLADKFIEHALDLTKPVNGMVIMLGRADFDFAKSRRKMFGEHPAFAGRLNMSKRPRWIEGSDGAPRFAYSWFWWNWEKLPTQQAVTIYDYDGGRDDD